jgi:hypothetical protein
MVANRFVAVATVILAAGAVRLAIVALVAVSLVIRALGVSKTPLTTALVPTFKLARSVRPSAVKLKKKPASLVTVLAFRVPTVAAVALRLGIVAVLTMVMLVNVTLLVVFNR